MALKLVSIRVIGTPERYTVGQIAAVQFRAVESIVVKGIELAGDRVIVFYANGYSETFHAAAVSILHCEEPGSAQTQPKETGNAQRTGRKAEKRGAGKGSQG